MNTSRILRRLRGAGLSAGFLARRFVARRFVGRCFVGRCFVGRRAWPATGLAAAVVLAACGGARRDDSAQSPRTLLAAAGEATPAQTALDVLRADRDFARRVSAASFPEALRAGFLPGVMMPVPPTRIVAGVDSVLAAFASSPDAGGRMTWTPVRAGVSGDGTHAYTVGMGSVRRTDGTRSQFKYLSYWIREGEGWRVAAWRRRPVDTNVVLDSTMLTPLLPARALAAAEAAGAARDVAAHRKSLMAAEQGFSDLAQRIGVGAAFAEMGDEQAVNVGPSSLGRFVLGPRAIALAVSGNQPLTAPSAITWNADTALVAPSGDLGITFGVIRPKQPPADNPNAGASFFTIWRRSSPKAPWRYVAE